MRFIRLLAWSSCLITLAGCAGMPVGWGGADEVTMANERSITVVYDPLVGGYDAANRAATEHCKHYSRSPVPTIREPHGVLTEQVFECR